MGFLNLFSKPEETVRLVRLPSGSFTISAAGEIVASTLPRSFPESHVKEIGTQILNTFRNARSIDLIVNEITINFAAMKITARELRGGAIIFLAPETTK